MISHRALQDRLAAIEAQLRPSVAPGHRLLSRRHGAARHDTADQVSPVLQQLLTEVLPGAMVLDWRQECLGHAGRMAADGLVFRFRVDAAGVGYRPAWDGLGQRGWELRSDSFLQLRAPTGHRLDFRRTAAPSGQKRQCTTGYSCWSSCISLQKECRIAPGSAIGKARLRRLQQLAAGGDATARATAQQVQAARGAAAVGRMKERNSKRVEKLLERPEIAEYLRTGKLPQPASASTEPGTVRNMTPGEITFDPSRFQYKLNATEGTGEVGSLSGVRKWDPNLAGVMSVWKDPADDKVYVVNGHNRLSLARRLGAEEVTVRFLNAANATEARAIGALQNIAEGAGTPMDAAKFFRDTGIKSQSDVEARGLPLGSGQAEKGLRLSKLPGDVFNAVVRGDLTVNRGAIIGGSGLDEAKQREVFKMVSARKAIADQTLLELVEHAAASEQRTQTTMDLFGMSQEAKDNLFTRAKLSAGLKAKIAREKRLFGTVSKARAATTLQQKGGNVINQEQSAKVAGEASEALAVFERLKSSSGPISSALNRAADRVEAGESEGRVRQELERDVFAAVEQELVSLGLRKRPRADSLQERIDALKRKCSTGYGCGSSCISLRKECRSSPRSATGKERLKRLLALAACGPSSQRGIDRVKAKEAGELAGAITARRGEKAAQLREGRQPAASAKAGAKPQKPHTPTPQINEPLSTGGLPSHWNNYDVAQERANNKGGLKFWRSRDGRHPAYFYFFRDRAAAEHWLSDDNAKADADGDVGTANRRSKEWQAAYKESYNNWRNTFNKETSDYDLLQSAENQASSGKATRGGTLVDVRIAGNKHSRPVRESMFRAKPEQQGSEKDKARLVDQLKGYGVRLSAEQAAQISFGDAQKMLKEEGDKWAAKRKAKTSEASTSVLSNPSRQAPGPERKPAQPGLNSQDVTTSSQQAAFARQQQQAAKAAGDQRGAEAWRKEERTVERQRLQGAITRGQQSQSSLFGATEYDQTMPLFQQPAAAAGPRQTPKISDVLRATTEQLKAADARQMGKIAENLFEAGWTIDRRTRYRGMSKDQAREQFKVEFSQKMQQQAASPEAAANSAAMRQRAGASGSVAGAMKSILEDMKAQDQRLEDLQRQSIDLRIQAEEQFGSQGGEDPTLGGGRPRRRLGGSRRSDAAADILEARIDALRMQCTPLAR